jgi:hypothetical protein
MNDESMDANVVVVPGRQGNWMALVTLHRTSCEKRTGGTIQSLLFLLFLASLAPFVHSMHM